MTPIPITCPSNTRSRPSQCNSRCRGFFSKLNVVAYRRVNGRLNEVYRGPLSSMVIDPSMDPGMGNVAQGESHQWIFEFGIDSSAGNIYQGATLQFSLVYDSTQTGNPNWAE